MAAVRGTLVFAPAIASAILGVASCGTSRSAATPSQDAAVPEAASSEAGDAPGDSLPGFGESASPCTDDALAPESGEPFFCPVVVGGPEGETCWSGSQYCSTVVSIGQSRPAIVRTCFDFPCGCGAEPRCECVAQLAAERGCPVCSDDAGMVVIGCVAP